jgi:NhaP-type Na+/H+ or K+/H+ antiporter
MKFESWYLVIGALLVAVSLVSSVVRRLPLTTTLLYFGVGMMLGPLGFRVARIDPLQHFDWLERLAELGVIVSLFTAGLKLRTPLRHKDWAIPFRLAFLSMGLTVGIITVVGVFGLGLPVGAAVLLGAILAPTDPVLASDVQLESAADRDKLRFNLTGEAGFNDGTAFPFVMLGLGYWDCTKWVRQAGDGSRWTLCGQSRAGWGLARCWAVLSAGS